MQHNKIIKSTHTAFLKSNFEMHLKSLQNSLYLSYFLLRICAKKILMHPLANLHMRMFITALFIMTKKNPRNNQMVSNRNVTPLGNITQ